MKNTFLVGRLVLLFFVFVVAFLACAKTETIEVNVHQPVSRFSVSVTDIFFRQTQGTVTFIDSNFYFLNTSDSGTSISYRWNFGDGSSSTEKNPKHSYSKRGSYTVTLTVSNQDKAFDSLQQTISVINGQRHISLESNVSLSPVDIHETATNDFLLMASSSNNNYLFRLDSLLKQKSMKTFPSTTRFLSMRPTTDGNFILAGSTQAINRSDELIKMNTDGTLLWNKVLVPNDSYSSAFQTEDGGYAAVGARPSMNYQTVVVKTDATGNLQWQKLLDGEGMMFTRNLVVEQDGMVISGIKKGPCSECDSILVVKLNNSGAVVWKSTVFGGMNNFVWWDNYISKLANGNYAVVNGYIKAIYFFSPSGEFLDRKFASNQAASVISSGDGNILALQNEYSNGFRLKVSKLRFDGAQLWYAYPDGRQKTAGGYSCCNDSRPGSIQLLRKGGILVTGSAYISNVPGNNDHDIILLMELDEAGLLK
jgi:PKD repeat protein